MDVMLGPSTSDFRLAAAQVADEFQRPLVSWSLPEIMGVSFVRNAQSTAPGMAGIDMDRWEVSPRGTNMGILAKIYGGLNQE